jgi:hypothetical protein
MANPVSIPVRVEQIRRDPDRRDGHAERCVQLRITSGQWKPTTRWACVEGCLVSQPPPIPGVALAREGEDDDR